MSDVREKQESADAGHWRFNPAPGWPPAPDGWVPGESFRPDPLWPPAPAQWQFWVWEPSTTDATPPGTTPDSIQPPVPAEVPPTPPAPAPAPKSRSTGIGFFGARAKARELAAEVERLRSELARLGALPAVQMQEELESLEQQIQQSRTSWTTERAGAEAEISKCEAQLAELRADVVTTEETAILQEVGVYEYRHPLDDSVAYKSQLSLLKDEIKTQARTYEAVTASTTWTVDNSLPKGRKMVRDISKLMLRAYNAEADNLVRSMKPYKLGTAMDRLDKVHSTIGRLGTAMSIAVSDDYHALRLRELELTADYLQMVAEEKERAKEERARLREEQKAQQELERERQRLIKERAHHENALAALRDRGDNSGADRLQAELDDIDRAISDVDYRVANVRAGYVYVVSNVGSFGERIVKIGMTRRLEPKDRIRELSDASVPFNFDTHALFFSKDAWGVEAEMHRRFADRRVNRVNRRREFFYATPDEVRDMLAELTGDLIAFEAAPEAAEYHQSVNEQQDTSHHRRSL